MDPLLGRLGLAMPMAFWQISIVLTCGAVLLGWWVLRM
jgi:hypothetical protein